MILSEHKQHIVLQKAKDPDAENASDDRHRKDVKRDQRKADRNAENRHHDLIRPEPDHRRTVFLPELFEFIHSFSSF